MATEQQAKRIFLFGTIGLGALIVAGLVWAIAVGSDNGGAARGTLETGLKFNDDNDPSLGPGEAKAVVRIFSDFQCPACKQAEVAFKAVREKYKDRIRFVWNDFPLSSMHPNAKAAAIAARCAEDQGKFWEYNEVLYANQEAWSDLAAPTAFFMKYAESLGLKKETFSSCLVNQTDLRKIQADQEEGVTDGVQGTPTFFLGNRRIVGGLDGNAWDEELLRLLSNP